MSSLSRLPIGDLRDRYGLRAFVETGCYLGDGIQAALHAGFEFAWSCDISELHVTHCRSRFGGDERVQVQQADSVTFLSSLVGMNREPTLFWLDAHFPAFYGFERVERKVGRFPLLDELRILARLPGIEHDVVLCDDLRVIADEANPRWRPGEQGEEWQVRDFSFKDLVNTLTGTHEATVWTQDEGVLAIVPVLTASA